MRRRDIVPLELRALKQWVGWRWATRAGRRTKPPCTADGSRPASCDDPSTWDSFEAVCAGVDSRVLSGVGFQLSAEQPYTAVDLDHCRDPSTGMIEPAAEAVIARLCSYTELSPSGTGVHILVKARKGGGRCRQGRIELYDHGRYVTVTGRHLMWTPASIEDRHTELEALYRELWPDHKPADGTMANGGTTLVVATDVIAVATAARNGAKFAALLGGDTSGHGGDHSAADLALCSMAAFYTRDVDVIDEVMRRSGLMRAKWERVDYRDRTIAAALRGSA